MFSDLLSETKGFKYQTTLKVTFRKCKPNGEIEFRPVSYNSTTISTVTVTSHEFSLENALYRIDDWINKEFDWIVELIESQCIKISTNSPFSGISYVKLPAELRRPQKGIINIKKLWSKMLFMVSC